MILLFCITAVIGDEEDCDLRVMPWVYGPKSDIEETTWHRYETVIHDQEANVIVAAGYSNFYGKYTTSANVDDSSGTNDESSEDAQARRL